MKTFYFNTGVKGFGHNPPVKLGKGQIWSSNGIKLIPFDCEDVPPKAHFWFACDNPELSESKREGVIVRKIHNSTLCSEYAYFKVLK